MSDTGTRLILRVSVFDKVLTKLKIGGSYKDHMTHFLRRI